MFKDFLLLKAFVVPWILRIIYWLGTLAAVGYGIYSMLGYYGDTLTGLGIILGGIIGIRVITELLMVPFTIERRLRSRD